MKKQKKIILIASIVIFIVSLTQPAFYIDRTDYDAWSNPIGIIFIGWLGAIIGGGSALTWFANPLILISWLFVIKSEKIAIVSGVLASIISFAFLFFDKIVSSEAPTYSLITEYKLGYWLWMISICLFTLGIIIIRIIKNQKEK
ncbi:hypothetical protein [Confluentibacter citreus]|uniref:hypothetical protein n=1 Tax=Confluentibacter citreus TaxID=2007307 RepID=UPI000C28D6EF|nr:hypothetical protein [Confluentibacter citreus]